MSEHCVNVGNLHNVFIRKNDRQFKARRQYLSSYEEMRLYEEKGRINALLVNMTTEELLSQCLYYGAWDECPEFEEFYKKYFEYIEYNSDFNFKEESLIDNVMFHRRNYNNSAHFVLNSVCYFQESEYERGELKRLLLRDAYGHIWVKPYQIRVDEVQGLIGQFVVARIGFNSNIGDYYLEGMYLPQLREHIR